jgi:hypothetical protein
MLPLLNDDHPRQRKDSSTQVNLSMGVLHALNSPFFLPVCCTYGDKSLLATCFIRKVQQSQLTTGLNLDSWNAIWSNLPVFEM